MLNGPLSLAPRFNGVPKCSKDANRFSGFSRRVETAEAVLVYRDRSITPLKRGVNERELIQGTALEICGPASSLRLASGATTRRREPS